MLKRPIALPGIYVAFSATASISDGLQHTFGFGVRHEDGEFAYQQPALGPLNFQINPSGRRMRTQTIMQFARLIVPGPGDYDLVVFIDGLEIASTPLYVDVIVGSAAG